MTLDISVSTVGAACTVATLTGKIIHSIVVGALEKRDDRIKALEDDRVGLKATQSVLFNKLDKQTDEFAGYKLHVAETYIAEAKLEKIIAPVVNRLERIEDDLRDQARDRT